MTVGAVDIGGTKSWYDDTRHRGRRGGHTLDGFAKPEAAAPGRYDGRPGSGDSSLVAEAAGQGHRAWLHPALGHVLLGPRGRRGGSP